MPEKLLTFLDQLAAMGPYMMPALLARLIWHNYQAKRGKRRGLAVGALAMEGAIAVFSTYIGLGLAEYAAVGPKMTALLVGVCAWVGPTGMQAMLVLWLQKRGLLPTDERP